MLPTIDEIQKWSDEKLESVIQSGEAINWDCGMGESQFEIDCYIQLLFWEYARRDNNNIEKIKTSNL